MVYKILPIDDTLRKVVVDLIKENWGSEIIVSRGKSHDAGELLGFAATVDEDVVGIITYAIENGECEIVSLDSFLENHGVGSALINKVIGEAEKSDCRRIWLITSNDNTHALRFYQKRGCDMLALHRNAIEEARKVKPQIPLKGMDGIPIKHEIEFELDLKR